MNKTLFTLLFLSLSSVAQAQYTGQPPAAPPSVPSSAAILKGDGAGNAVAATGGTDYGYPGIPVLDVATAYTTLSGDRNTLLRHPSTDNNARTITIDSNANVAYPVGTFLVFVNEINVLTIAITSDTLTLMGANTTGSKTLAAGNVATAVKVTTTKWVISGSAGLTWVLPADMLWILAA
jgi:hypothetical protein